jgi:hypothetical protein
MRNLLIIVVCNGDTMPPNYPPRPTLADEWRSMVNSCLKNEQPLFTMSYGYSDVFRATFIEPHLEDAYIRKEDFNMIYPATWFGKEIYYVLINAIPKYSEEFRERLMCEIKLIEQPEQPTKRDCKGNWNFQQNKQQ